MGVLKKCICNVLTNSRCTCSNVTEDIHHHNKDLYEIRLPSASTLYHFRHLVQKKKTDLPKSIVA